MTRSTSWGLAPPWSWTNAAPVSPESSRRAVPRRLAPGGEVERHVQPPPLLGVAHGRAHQLPLAAAHHQHLLVLHPRLQPGEPAGLLRGVEEEIAAGDRRVLLQAEPVGRHGDDQRG